ncbi:MAG: ferrochelatase [Chloroflexota bacterium]
MSAQSPTGVLLLAYGGPRRQEEVAAFLAAVTGGRPLPPSLVAEFEARYRRIGGSSPLPAIVDSVAEALRRRLAGEAATYRVAVGHLFTEPSIAAAVEALRRDGIGRAVAVTLVPQYSRASVGRYFERLEREMERAGEPFPATTVRSWATQPRLAEAFARSIDSALDDLSPTERTMAQVLFTAHSIPVTAAEGDPFEAELRATAAAVAARVGISGWRLAYQSAGRGGGPWLGPSVSDTMSSLAAEGKRTVLVVPIHFLIDNLEVLFDLDVTLREQAQSLGVRLLRTECPNDSPLLVTALAQVVKDNLG